MKYRLKVSLTQIFGGFELHINLCSDTICKLFHNIPCGDC